MNQIVCQDGTRLTRRVLFDRLDFMVSSIVRHSSSKCVTCNKKLLLKKRQAGHYISRAVYSTRWDLRNVNVQCNECNVLKGGNLAKYEQWIAKEEGLDTLEYLKNEKNKYDKGQSEFCIEDACKKYNHLLETGNFDEKTKKIVSKWPVIQL